MRVLVVEDQRPMREAIARRLRGDGHGVDEAPDADEAESFLASYAYDVLVLDRMLPDGDALDRLVRWRADGLTTPTLFLTARDLVEDRLDGFAAGADDYLIKPFSMDELVARIQALARRAASTTPSRVTIDDLELDLGRRTVRRAGVLLTLRPKEYAVLELLAGRVGQVLEHRELVSKCWGEDHEPTSNVHEVVIAALRRKLGKPRLIHTVRGTGYTIEGIREDTGGDGDAPRHA